MPTFVSGQVPTAAELNAITTEILEDGASGAVWTPTLTQSVTVTKTVEYASYERMGPMVLANMSLAITGAGTAANQIIVGLPPITFVAYRLLGTGAVFDASVGTWYVGDLIWNSPTTAKIWPNAATSALGATSFTAALAAGDIVAYQIMCQAT